MKWNKEKKHLVCISIIVMLLIVCSGCQKSRDNDVILFDYETAIVASDVYYVTDSDMEIAIKAHLLEREVLLSKISFDSIVEDGDVVHLTVQNNGENQKQVKMSVDEAEMDATLYTTLMGMHMGEKGNFIENEIEYEFVVNGIYFYAEKLDDDIAQRYFGMEKVEDVEKFIRDEIEEHRIFEYLYERLISESMVKVHSEERSAYIERAEKYIQAQAREMEMSVDTYIQDQFGCEPDVFFQSVSDLHDEYIILRAVMNKEGVSIGREEYEKHIEQLTVTYGMDREELLSVYGEELVYHSIMYEKVYDILTNL